MEKDRISVIVPVYNGEKYLKRCIGSILTQTCRELQVILVNDGSTDKSPEICNRYARRDKRVKVIHKENGGLMSAWQAGLFAAEGSYVSFVDCDDWIEPLMLEELRKQTEGTGREIICCNHTIDRERSGEMIMERRCHGLAPGIYSRRELEKQVFPCILGNENRLISMSRCMKLISRKLLEDNLKYCDPEIRMGEDVTVMLPAILDADRVVILKEAWYYHYYFNPGSMVHRYDRGLLPNIEGLAHVIRRILMDKGVEGAVDQERREYLLLLMLVIKNEIRGNRENCKEEIRKLCSGEDVRDALVQYPLRLKGRAEQLIYMVMKKPSAARILLLSIAMKIYDGRQPVSDP